MCKLCYENQDHRSGAQIAVDALKHKLRSQEGDKRFRSGLCRNQSCPDIRMEGKTTCSLHACKNISCDTGRYIHANILAYCEECTIPKCATEDCKNYAVNDLRMDYKRCEYHQPPIISSTPGDVKEKTTNVTSKMVLSVLVAFPKKAKTMSLSLKWIVAHFLKLIV